MDNRRKIAAERYGITWAEQAWILIIVEDENTMTPEFRNAADGYHLFNLNEQAMHFTPEVVAATLDAMLDLLGNEHCDLFATDRPSAFGQYGAKFLMCGKWAVTERTASIYIVPRAIRATHNFQPNEIREGAI